jgi:hypothetical protein
MPVAELEQPAVCSPDRRGSSAPAVSREFDRIEQEMAKHPQVRLPLRHLFTPGLYIRECFLPAGTRLTSKIHMSEHPFVISMGRVTVWSGIEGEEPQVFGAPYTGVTKPGTRRVIHAHEDTIWSTFHPTNETDVAKIERELIFKHDEHLPFTVTAEGEAVPKPPVAISDAKP